jgi:hypothetical protein
LSSKKLEPRVVHALRKVKMEFNPFVVVVAIQKEERDENSKLRWFPGDDKLMFMEEDCMLQICGVWSRRRNGSKERRK